MPNTRVAAPIASASTNESTVFMRVYNPAGIHARNVGYTSFDDPHFDIAEFV